ncbi:MAG: radical SAM protein, partial [Coriobacteriales bacterium]|nr:radical SAM protein [Coriobacteriales bacterium]
MNVSRYTIVVESKGGETLLYNTASGSFAAVKGQDIEAHADELAALGFLTELDRKQELAGQQALFDVVRANRDSLTLSLIPTYACNYRCPYCYEPELCKSTGKMSSEVEAGIIRFIEHIFAQHPFMKLSVQWYGGEPTLALDVVERLSNELIEWCSERRVAYDAMMLTNAALIDESAARMLARCKVGQVFLTIEGPKEYQDRRRLSADGSSSFDAAIGAARLLRVNGIQVKAGMNADRLTLPYYDDLRERLYREEGIELDLNKLNDYGNTFGQPPFAKPDFDLFTHDEFFQLQA